VWISRTAARIRARGSSQQGTFSPWTHDYQVRCPWYPWGSSQCGYDLIKSGVSGPKCTSVSHFVESQSGEMEPALARDGSFNSALIDVIGHPKACGVPDRRASCAAASRFVYTTQSSRTFRRRLVIVTTFGVSLPAAPNYSVVHLHNATANSPVTGHCSTDRSRTTDLP
jgi:hypothetical protein